MVVRNPFSSAMRCWVRKMSSELLQDGIARQAFNLRQRRSGLGFPEGPLLLRPDDMPVIVRRYPTAQQEIALLLVGRGADTLDQGMSVAVYGGALIDWPGGDKTDAGSVLGLTMHCQSVAHF